MRETHIQFSNERERGNSTTIFLVQYIYRERGHIHVTKKIERLRAETYFLVQERYYTSILEKEMGERE